MAKTTKIVFDQAGGMKVDAIGFTGKACEDTTAKLLAGLGSSKVDETKKPEFNQLSRTSSDAVAPNRWG